MGSLAPPGTSGTSTSESTPSEHITSVSMAGVSPSSSTQAAPINSASSMSSIPAAPTPAPTLVPLTLSSVVAAHRAIKPYIHETPVLTCRTLDELASTPQSAEALQGTPWAGQEPARPRFRFFFKCENFQKGGAFKIRGATHSLSHLEPEELRKGVMTHSSGNHAQALALAARQKGVPAYIVMPHISTPSKIAATKGYGGQVTFSGSTEPERAAVAARIQHETGATFIPPYDHAHTICGQGTIGLELEDQVADIIEEDPARSAHNMVRSRRGSAASSAANSPKSTAATPALSVSPALTLSPSSASPSPATLSPDAAMQPAQSQARSSPPSSASAPTTTPNPSAASASGPSAASASAPVPPPVQWPSNKHTPGPLDAVIAPLGGGGMLSGIGLALSESRTWVFGAEPNHDGANDGQRGLAAGKRIEKVSTLTIADGLRTPVGAIPWNIISDHQFVRGVYSVSDAQIAAALRLVLERMKLTVEPSAVVGLAVALYDEDFRRTVEREGGKEGWDLGVVLSGGNTTVEALARLYADDSKGKEEVKRNTQDALGK